MPPGGLAFSVLGMSTSLWNGSVLPLSLASFGMPGCTAYISADVAVLVVAVGSTATMAFQIPTTANLLGVQFHDQALVLDPVVNALGAVVSNAATATIGGR